jgi:hypothetical protein
MVPPVSLAFKIAFFLSSATAIKALYLILLL